METLRGHLGTSWEVLGRLWRLPGTNLEKNLQDFRDSYAIYENSEKPKKTYGFSLIFDVLGRFWSLKHQKNRLKSIQNRRKIEVGGQEGDHEGEKNDFGGKKNDFEATLEAKRGPESRKIVYHVSF